MIKDRVMGAWATFQETSGGVKRPETEGEYLELRELLNDLTDRHDCNEPPYAPLFDLVAAYLHDWELEHERELKGVRAAPHEMLAHLMEARGVSQYQLAKDGVSDQANLSRILNAQAGISKGVAKRLAKYFGVSVELFL